MALSSCVRACVLKLTWIWILVKSALKSNSNYLEHTHKLDDKFQWKSP